MTEKSLTEDQVYFKDVFDKFDTNPDDPALRDTERVLLGKIQNTQKVIAKIAEKIEDLNTEIKDRQEQGNQLVQQLVHLQGQSQGFIDSLLALR